MSSNALRPPRVGRSTGGLALLAVAFTLAQSAAAASLAPGVHEKLAAATFEVVLAKPVDDPLTYEKPLPLELIPFRERTDKYQSMGTAFAIAPNRFVTAAHVLAIGSGSQFGLPALRDAGGRVYPVDSVLKFSGSEDYAVFSVHAGPAVVPLEIRARPPLNQAVFAVGNAFGEGVVIRDGLYTSDTPEEIDGRWQWLRFSAAASPGNSGGPLVDRNGKVIGVVVRKSPNENLNFALAIGQVTEGSEETALLEGRSTYRMPLMKSTDTVDLKDKVPLPNTIAAFYAAMQARLFESYTKYRAEYVKHHEAEMFPHGASSVQLLNSVYSVPFPRLITESDTGEWTLPTEQPQRAQLEHNGSVEFAVGGNVGILKLRPPDDVPPAKLYADSKQLIDILLKAIPLKRMVGTEPVRITSLGKAQQESWYTDDYGRSWQLRSWLLPYNDVVIETMMLPMPDGDIVLMTQSPTSIRAIVREEMKGLADFVYVSYEGSLRQWQEYMADASIRPAGMRALTLQVGYGRGLGLKTPRFQLLVPAGLQTIDADSTMTIKFGFFKDGETTVWDVCGVYLADAKQHTQWIDVLRRLKPPDSLPEEFATRWKAMTTGIHPYDSVAFVGPGDVRIEMVANAKDVAAGRSNMGYTLMVGADGPHTPASMKSKLATVDHGFTAYEH